MIDLAGKRVDVDPVYQYRCRAFGNYAAFIASTLDPSTDLIKGDGADTDTFPAFVASAGGVPSHYVFDGVDDCISNWPPAPAAFTVVAIVDTDGNPEMIHCNDSTIEDLLTTAGAFTGSLYCLAIFDTVLDAEDLALIEYWWVSPIPRGAAAGVDHRLILDEQCILAVYFSAADPNKDESLSEADTTDAGVTYDDDGATFGTSGHVVPEGLTSDSDTITIVFSGAVTGGTVLVWGDLELTISEAAGIATVDLSGSSAAIPAGSVYAVSIESGGYPKVYSDGEYRADGDAVVSFGALTTDPVIGNIV